MVDERPDDGRLSPEEDLDHGAGAVRAAFDWFDAVVEGSDYAAAWRLSDEEYRLTRAQAWLWNNRGAPDIAGADLDEQAASIARAPSPSPLWPEFASTEVEMYQEAWAIWRQARIGAVTEPMPGDPGYEVVVLTDTDAEFGPLTGADDVAALVFLVHLVDGQWLVAQAGTDTRAVPGWPPTF